MANKVTDMESTDLAKSIESLRADLTKLTDMVASVAKSQTDNAAARVNAAVSGVGNVLSETADRVARNSHDLAADAQAQLRGATTEIESQIAKNPWTSILVVGAIGMIFGMMSRNRD